MKQKNIFLETFKIKNMLINIVTMRKKSFNYDESEEMELHKKCVNDERYCDKKKQMSRRAKIILYCFKWKNFFLMLSFFSFSLCVRMYIQLWQIFHPFLFKIMKWKWRDKKRVSFFIRHTIVKKKCDIVFPFEWCVYFMAMCVNVIFDILELQR